MNDSSLAALLSQDQWLRRIARHLVRDPDLADDLAQEAWLAGLAAGRTDVESRPWLKGVLWNKASSVFRKRRSAVQGLGALASESPPASTSSPESVVADLQLREQLAAEIQRLDEPERGAIHAVYFRGLSLREAAAEIGVSRNTVSLRAQRGLAALRLRLDERYEGSRSAWLLALLPWAQEPVATPAAESTLPKTLVSRAGGRLIALAGVGVAAAVTAFVLLTARATERPEDLEIQHRGTSFQSGVKVVLSEPPRPPEERSESSAPVAGALQSRARILATILDPSGAPAAGARWRLDGWSANRDRVEQHGLPRNWEDPAGTLDDLGRLRIDLLPPQAFQFTLSVYHDGAADEGWRWEQIRVGEERDLGIVKLRPAGEIEVRVLDVDGSPYRGKPLYVRANEVRQVPGSGREQSSFRGRTDAQTGSLKIAQLPMGKVDVRLYGAELVDDKKSINLVADRASAVTFQLRKAHTRNDPRMVRLSPRPFMTEESLVELDEIWLVDNAGHRWRASSFDERQGAYVFAGAPHEPATVVVQAEGFERREAALASGGGVPSVRVRGTSGVALTVLGPDGGAVEVYSVAGCVAPKTVHVAYESLHDGNESVPGGVIKGLFEGSFDLEVRAACGRATVRVDDMRKAELRSLSVRLEPTMRVTGDVTSSEGDPVAGETVALFVPGAGEPSEDVYISMYPGDDNEPEAWRRCVRFTQTRVDGTFDIEVDEPGRYLIVAGIEGRPFCWSKPFDLQAGETREGVHLTVPVAGGIDARVIMPDHLPQSGWAIQYRHVGMAGKLGARFDWPALDEEGRFAVGGLMPGTVNLYARRNTDSMGLDSAGNPTDAYRLGAIEIKSGEIERADIAFPDGGPGLLRLHLDWNGLTTGKARFVATSLEDGMPWHSTASDRATAGEPTFSKILNQGRYHLFARGVGWAVDYPHEILIRADGPTEVDLELGPPRAELSIFSGGMPAANRRIRVRPTSMDQGRSQSLSVSGKTDPGGKCSLALSPGTWTFELLQDGGSSRPGSGGAVERRVEVTWPSSPAEVEF